jgi:hypothetical protein
MQNETVYPTDVDKILFILSLMNEGVPGEWKKHWMTRLISKKRTMPTFDDFNLKLETRFIDPNLEQLEY